MNILRKTAAALLSCTMILTMAGCAAEPEEETVPKPEDIPETALVVDYLGLAVELPDALYAGLGQQIFASADTVAAPDGVQVNGQVLFLYQSGSVYNRVLELQATGEQLSEEEYLALTQQTGDLFAITSIATDTIGDTDLADCTGFAQNELIGELGGNSFYLSDGELTLDSLSEEDAATLESFRAAIPQVKEGVTLYSPISLEDTQLDVGVNISGFSTTTMEGEEMDSSVFAQADLTVLNVWATYCTPCVSEMPDLETLSQNYRDKGVQVIGLVADVYDDEEQLAAAKEIVTATGVTYPSLLPDQKLDASVLRYVTGVPTTLFVDSEGTVLQIISGTRSLDAFTEIVDSLLNK